MAQKESLKKNKKYPKQTWEHGKSCNLTYFAQFFAIFLHFLRMSLEWDYFTYWVEILWFLGVWGGLGRGARFEDIAHILNRLGIWARLVKLIKLIFWVFWMPQGDPSGAQTELRWHRKKIKGMPPGHVTLKIFFTSMWYNMEISKMLKF